MNALADYCAANLRNLGLKYVIWKQRINSGDSRGWRAMADRGGITANHYDHVHITFSGSSCSGKNCAGARAVGDDQAQFSSSSSAAPTPAWVVAIIVISTLTAIGTLAIMIVLFRAMRNMA
jgi:hypothetical protein